MLPDHHRQVSPSVKHSCNRYRLVFQAQTPSSDTAPPTGLPPELMQAIVHQISQQAAVMATAASGGPSSHMTPGLVPAPEGTTTPHPHPHHPTQARVIITRPSFPPRLPPPTGTRGTTINLRTTVPPAGQVTPEQSKMHFHSDSLLMKSYHKTNLGHTGFVCNLSRMKDSSSCGIV